MAESGSPVLVCRIARTLCALPLAHVVETLRPLPLGAAPSAPGFVSGVTLLRGEPTPVVDAARLLGGDAETCERRVVLRVGGRSVALAVAGVVGVQRLTDSAARDLPPLLANADPRLVAEVAQLDAELLLVLESAAIVASAA
jgi:purine-binding chemotaxis protein CheW